ncbi:hypothetical protein [Alishewanella longhuensis]
MGSFPGPVQVAQQWSGLVAEHKAEKARQAAFFQRQQERNAATLAANPDAVVTLRPYNGRPTFFSQIFTSLYTVLTGFILASILAIPAGIVIGLSASFTVPLTRLFNCLNRYRRWPGCRW